MGCISFGQDGIAQNLDFMNSLPLGSLQADSPLDPPTISSSTSASVTTPSSQSETSPTISTVSTIPNSRKRSSAEVDPEAARENKRMRNTLAARKYRQKGRDRIAELEKALEEVTKERDEMKLRLAGMEGEMKVLRELAGKKG